MTSVQKVLIRISSGSGLQLPTVNSDENFKNHKHVYLVYRYLYLLDKSL